MYTPIEAPICSHKTKYEENFASWLERQLGDLLASIFCNSIVNLLLLLQERKEPRPRPPIDTNKSHLKKVKIKTRRRKTNNQGGNSSNLTEKKFYANSELHLHNDDGRTLSSKRGQLRTSVNFRQAFVENNRDTCLKTDLPSTSQVNSQSDQFSSLSIINSSNPTNKLLIAFSSYHNIFWL